MTDVQRTYPADGLPDGIPAITQAIAHDRYGGPEVLELREIATPTPGPGEVLIEVAAASLNPYDWHFTTGTPYVMRLMAGVRRPKQTVRGADVAGRVAAVGEGVTTLSVGDRVAGFARGSFAGLALARATSVAPAPDGLDDAEAAAMPMAAITALQALRDQGDVRAGQRVLVIGAGGGVGSFAVQIAAAMGAEVSGVCSTRNVELVRSLGATHVVDYTVDDWVGGTPYDVIVDNVGDRSIADCRRSLAPTGTYVMVGGSKSNPWIDPFGRLLAGKIGFAFRSPRFRWFTATGTTDDLAAVWRFVDAGQLRPVVDRLIELAEVPTVMRELANGHARGKTVVRIGQGQTDRS